MNTQQSAAHGRAARPLSGDAVLRQRLFARTTGRRLTLDRVVVPGAGRRILYELIADEPLPKLNCSIEREGC